MFDDMELELFSADEKRKQELKDDQRIASEINEKYERLKRIEMSQKMRNAPVQVKAPYYAPRSDAAQDTFLYELRYKALLRIINDGDLALSKQALSNGWKEVTDHPYTPELNRHRVNTATRDKLVAAMKAKGMKVTLSKLHMPPDYIDVIRKHYKDEYIRDVTEENRDLKKQIAQYKFFMDTIKDALVYRGHILKFSKKHRGFHIKLAGKDLVIPRNSVEKMQKVFAVIDTIEDF